MASDEAEIERFLKLESSSFNRDKECERILSMQYSPDPFVILDMPIDIYISCQCDDRAIKMQYRKRSLLVHPDKCKHPKAQEAFDILKKTEQMCMDPSKRRLVFEYINEARAQVFHEKRIKIPVEEEEVYILINISKDC
jgi:DnaJ family protein C protein 8